MGSKSRGSVANTSSDLIGSRRTKLGYPGCVTASSRLVLALLSTFTLACDPNRQDAAPPERDQASEPAPAPASTTTSTAPAASGNPSLAAFPGAEGWGARATGGRGGRVVYVDTLAASGPGSLQAALDQDGPRTIVFAVSGLIDAAIHLTHGDVTIAGQTSPGGITVRQFHTTEEPYCDQDVGCIAGARHAENWILRHVRIRPAGKHDDGLRLRYTRRAIIDHVSIGGATDEAVEISYSNQITLQHSILAETIGDHANLGGMLMNYSNPAQGFELTQLAIHHNVWHRIIGRLPELSRESAAAASGVMEIELSNNLLWDPGYFIDINNSTISASDEGQPIWYHLNWVGNLAHARGPGQPEALPFGMIHIARPLGTSAKTSTYFADNRMNLYPDRRDYDLMYCCNDYATEFSASPRPAFARDARHEFPPITYLPANELPEHAVARVGAFPRDPMDQRLFGQIAAGKIDPTPRDRNPANDGSKLPFTTAPAAPVDGDRDGMPDAWETAHGLDPAVQDHNGVQLSRAVLGVDGYTNLEVYLAELSNQRIGG